MRSDCKEKAVFGKIPRYVWTRPKIQRKYMTWLWNWHTLTRAGVNSAPLSAEPTPFVSSFAAHVWCFLFFFHARLAPPLTSIVSHGEPKKRQLLMRLRVQRRDEYSNMCVWRVSLHSAVSSPLMKVSFIYLIIYLQDSNNMTPPPSSALSRQEETRQTCQSVVGLLKSCISLLKQVSRQFEFEPWDVFIYLVDSFLLLVLKLDRSGRSQPGFSLSS